MKLKRCMALFLAVVLVLTGVQITNFVKANAAIDFEYGETCTVETEGLFVWDFGSFKESNVWKNFDAMTLNTNKVEVSNMVNPAQVRSIHVNSKKPAFNENAKIAIGTMLYQNGSNIDFFSKSPTVLYKNIGEVVNGTSKTKVDLQISLKDFKFKDYVTEEYKKKSFVTFSVCQPDKKNGAMDPVAIGVWPSTEVEWVDVEYTFYKSGTKEKINVSGLFTQVDLDWDQFFGYDENSSNVTKVVVSDTHKNINNGSDHLTTRTEKETKNGRTYNWQIVQASHADTNPKNPDTYKAGYISCIFNSTSSLSFRFGSKDGGLGFHNYFGITPYSIATFSAPKPYKYVIDNYDLDSNGNKISKLDTEAYKIDGDKEVTYVLDVYIPRSYHKNYSGINISDNLSQYGNIYNVKTEDIRVYQDSNMAIDGTIGDGVEVPDYFSITNSESNSNIIFNAPASTINETKGEFFGHSYQFVITVDIDSDALVASNLDVNSNGQIIIPNTAKCVANVWTYNSVTDTWGYVATPESSNEVNVYYAEPELEIIKDVRADISTTDTVQMSEWRNVVEVAEAPTGTYKSEVEYQVYVTNTNPSAEVYKLKVSDILPDSSNIRIDSISAEAYIGGVKYTPTDGTGVFVEKGSTTTTKSWTIVKKRLGSGTLTTKNDVNGDKVLSSISGDYIKVTMKGKVGVSGDINKASATHYYTNKSVTDVADVHTNVYTPKISVEKDIEDGYVVEGDSTKVTITIQQEPTNKDGYPAYISGIYDLMSVWDAGYYDVSKEYSDIYDYGIRGAYTGDYYGTGFVMEDINDYFVGSGDVPKIYKEVNGVKTEIEFDGDWWGEGGTGIGINDAYAINLELYEDIPFEKGEKIIIEYDVTAHPEPVYGSVAWEDYDVTYDIPVRNQVVVTDGDYTKHTAEDTAIVISPQLSINKRADKEAYEYGETAHYTVYLRQLEDYITSSVYYADYFLDDIFATSDIWADGISDNWYEDIVDSVKITNTLGEDVTSHFDIGFYERGNPILPYAVRSEATAPVLFISMDGDDYNPFALRKNYGYIIEYDVAFDEMVFKDYTDNVVEANNRAMLIPKNNNDFIEETVTSDERVEVYVPEVNIEKTVAQYSDTDATLEELMRLDFKDEITVDAGQVVWYRIDASWGSVLDLVRGFYIEDFEVAENLDVIEGSWKLALPSGGDVSDTASFHDYSNGGYYYLSEAYNTEYTVFFAAKVKTGTEGTTNVNTATVSASNAQEKSDTATVNVRPRPVLSIDKYSDKTNYTLGETGHYTIEVTNTVENSIARDIQVFDVIEDSVTVKENTIKATLIKSGATTGESWVVQPDTYSGTVLSVGRDGICIDFYIGGDTGSAERPNLEYGDKLVVEYDVVYNEAGDVVNDAEAYSSNADYVSTTNTVTVTDPSAELTIDKYAHKNSFVVGESPYYTLEISQVKEDAVAENITIVDYFDVWVDIEN